MPILYHEEVSARMVNDLSLMIYAALHSAASEQHAPDRTADESDDHIKEQLARAEALRQLRTQLENTLTGVLL